MRHIVILVNNNRVDECTTFHDRSLALKRVVELVKHMGSEETEETIFTKFNSGYVEYVSPGWSVTLTNG